MAQLLQIEIESRTAELYLNNNEAWQVKLVLTHPLQYQVVGANFMKGYGTLGELVSEPDLPELVKWAARGLPGIPQTAEFANGSKA